MNTIKEYLKTHKNRRRDFNFYQYPTPYKSSKTSKENLQETLDLNQSSCGRYTLYVSIPYCISKCNSCPFFCNKIDAENSRHIINEYIKIIKLQITNYSETKRFRSSRCDAIYFGGGTASLLPSNQLKRLLEFIRESLILSDDVEITLEGNPMDFTKTYLTKARENGVNRFSIGLQSLHDGLLRTLGSPDRKSVV